MTFGKQMKTSREVVGENPRLYYEIQSLGEFTPLIGGLLHEAVDQWQALVAAGDLEGFAEAMKDCRRFLAEARDETPNAG